MPGSDWVSGLTVVKLKDELKKRGQAVAGKKADLVARLEEYIQQNEVRRPAGGQRWRYCGCRMPAVAAVTLV